MAHVLYISLVFSNDHRVLAQCNTQLRFLYLLNNSDVKMKTHRIKAAIHRNSYIVESWTCTCIFQPSATIRMASFNWMQGNGNIDQCNWEKL